MTAKQRIINSYVRLVKDGKITIDEVPERYRELVSEQLSKEVEE